MKNIREIKKKRKTNDKSILIFSDPIDPFEGITADEETRQIIKGYDAEEEAKELKNISDRQNIKARKRYANKLFRLIKCWLYFVATLIFIVAVDVSGLPIAFSLPEPVLIAVLTTTTVNVIGLFVFVVRYLFPKTTPKTSQQIDHPT